MQKLILGVFAIAVMMFSTTMSHAQEYVVCGVGSLHPKCYPQSKLKEDHNLRMNGMCADQTYGSLQSCGDEIGRLTQIP